MSSQIIIGNNNYVGNNISVINGKVIIDGKEVESPEGKVVHVRAERIESLRVDHCQELTIEGDTGPVEAAQGSIRISGDVKGSVDLTQGNIDCENVAGDVSVTQGNIRKRG